MCVRVCVCGVYNALWELGDSANQNECHIRPAREEFPTANHVLFHCRPSFFAIGFRNRNITRIWNVVVVIDCCALFLEGYISGCPN